jgi:diacylglycerol kinase family enzyme
MGIDAYIADLSNKFKRIIPGDAYLALVDAGVLFYNHRAKPTAMEISMQSRDKEINKPAFIPSMVIFGTSGHRVYGKGKLILPGDENVCIVDSMSLLRKMKTKKLFYSGRHTTLPEVHFFHAESMQISYSGNIPMQLDGESYWLNKDHFPLTLKLLPPKIKVLRG